MKAYNIVSNITGDPFDWSSWDITPLYSSGENALMRGEFIHNKHQVTLHRGCSPIRYRSDDNQDCYDFIDPPDERGVLYPKQKDDGISMSIILTDSSEIMRQQAHDALNASCRHRMIMTLGAVINQRTNDGDIAGAEAAKTASKRITKVKDYLEMIKVISEDPHFREVDIPFCCVKIANPFYPWADLMADPVTERINPYHCLLGLTRQTHRTVVEEVGICADPGWSLCPHMLKASTKVVDELYQPEFDKRSATAVTCAIWDSLKYLILEFRQGCDFLNVEEGFEICLYLCRISNGELRFGQQAHSGLDKEPRLAAFIELAFHTGFYIEYRDPRTLSFIEHDISWALSQAHVDVRLIKSSFIALFDSGIRAHSLYRVSSFQKLPTPAIQFLIKLLRVKNIKEVCEELHSNITTIFKLGEDRFNFDWGTLVTFRDEYRESKLTDATFVAGLLDDCILIQPLVADGSATFMATYLSESTSMQFEKSMKRSEEVQTAFAMVMELYLTSTLGVFRDANGKPQPRATRFITALQSAVDTPEQLYLRTRAPNYDDQVHIGVFRIAQALTVEAAKAIGTSLHNLLSTMNSAVWRIRSRYRTWCTSLDSGFKLVDAILQNRRMGEQTADDITRAEKWANNVIAALPLDSIGIERDVNCELRSISPASTSFIILVAWDSDLFKRAFKTCEEEGLRRVGISKIELQQQWIVKMT